MSIERLRHTLFRNIDVLSIFIGAFVFYALTLEIKGMWLDEVYTVYDIKKNFGNMIISRMNHGHGPVYFSIMWLWIRIFGENEFWLRIPAILFGLGTAGISFILLKKHTYRLTALMGTYLLLMNMPFINLSHLVRMYTLVALLLMLCSYIIINAEENKKHGNILLLATISAIALLTHYSAGLFLLAQIIYLLLRRKPKWYLAGGIGLGFLCFLPWLLCFIFRGSRHNPLHWMMEPSFYSIFSLPARLAIDDNLTGIPSWGIYIISASVICVALRGVKILGRLGRFFLLMWAVPVLGACLFTLISGGDILVIVRYFSVTIVFQTLLIGAGLVSPWKNTPKLHYALALGLVATSLFLVSTYITATSFANWRIVAQELNLNKEKDEKVLFIGRAGKWDVPIRYYYKGPLLSNASLQKWKDENPDKDLEKFILSQTGRRLLVIISPRFLEAMKIADENHEEFSKMLHSLVMKNYQINKEIRVNKVRLLHMEKRPLLQDKKY
ncbi:glycosyltransferase family 39 protein [Thermodesulfobacteriota bacterium]